ncbi:hypothetical protein KC669_02580 [Candidatus Dojkabacteria bacterium]|uniref:Uncharacterized protein n=1 Tax=Candidatus Dojkabacteria bacterium TaxID=2099670 RepID=A0A955LA80_9BACT|nr:hypothetical protein [Candidatus Dojkabacteria bacterium]
MFTDPGKRQYLMFSFLLALIFSAIVSFFFADILEGPLVSGFPVSVSNLSGVVKFISMVFNTVVLSLMLTIPTYYLLSWLNRKAGGGGF